MKTISKIVMSSSDSFSQLILILRLHNFLLSHRDITGKEESPARSVKERDNATGEERKDVIDMNIDAASNSDSDSDSSSSTTTPRESDASFSSRHVGNHSNFDQADSNTDASSTISLDTGSYDNF